jgi:hypothetical protein
VLQIKETGFAGVTVYWKITCSVVTKPVTAVVAGNHDHGITFYRGIAVRMLRLAEKCAATSRWSLRPSRFT